MNVLTCREVRASFKQTLDSVCKDHKPTVITRRRGEHVVMMSLDDYNSIQETLHLLGSEKNALRLRESLAGLARPTM
ncbi:Antitoxin [Cupriavidus necator]|uniref:type II toxin-antitoxin system Phd/YefM family antitoxin n=1 Tax=Cupriavidus necator TaxID=106590 RepID=UPI003F73D77E